MNRLPDNHHPAPGPFAGHEMALDSRRSIWGAGAAYGAPSDLEQDETFNPLHFFIYIIRYRWLIATFLVAGLVLGVLVTFLMTPKYRANALLEIAPPTAQIIKDLQVMSESADIRTFRTALEKLRSRQMMERVIHELGLTENRKFLFPPKAFSLGNLFSRARRRMGEQEDPIRKLSPAQRKQLALGRLKAGLSAQLVRNTRILRISFSHPDPEIARQVANQFATSFIAANLDQSAETSRLARQFIAEQVEETKKKLEKAEKALVSYAKKANITFSDKEGSLIAENIRAINAALSQAIQERLKLERLVRQVTLGRASELEEVINNEAIQSRRSKIAELEAKYREQLSIFKPDYPDMRRLSAQIATLKRMLAQDIQGIANGIRLKYKVAKEKEQSLRTKLRELEAQQKAFQDKQIQYTILKREVDSYRTQYKSLIDKMNQLSVASEVKNQSASIVEYADTPASPFSPSLVKNLAIALLLSGMAAAGTIYVLELMNNTFVNPDQVEQELKQPVLGIIPKLREEELQTAVSDTRSAFSEAVRTLRTSLQFTGIDGAPRSLVVTSTEPQEGKSTIARKLAEEFGALGMNVLLVDADMRKPVQHRFANLANTLGLSNLLTNTVPVGEVEEEVQVMRNSPWPNVWLVTAGTPPPNPANLLASQKMAMFVEAAQRRFDIVIIDAPPVIGLADALLLSRLAEATLVVVAANTAPRKAVQNSLRKIDQAGGKVVGVAFNRFDFNKIEYKYTYKYTSYGSLAYGEAYTYGDNAGASDSSGRKTGSIGRFLRFGRGDSPERSVADDAERTSGVIPPPEPPEHGGENKPGQEKA